MTYRSSKGLDRHHKSVLDAIALPWSPRSSPARPPVWLVTAELSAATQARIEARVSDTRSAAAMRRVTADQEMRRRLRSGSAVLFGLSAGGVLLGLATSGIVGWEGSPAWLLLLWSSVLTVVAGATYVSMAVVDWNDPLCLTDADRVAIGAATHTFRWSPATLMSRERRLMEIAEDLIDRVRASGTWASDPPFSAHRFQLDLERWRTETYRHAAALWEYQHQPRTPAMGAEAACAAEDQHHLQERAEAEVIWGALVGRVATMLAYAEQLEALDDLLDSDAKSAQRIQLAGQMGFDDVASAQVVRLTDHLAAAAGALHGPLGEGRTAAAVLGHTRSE